MNPVELFKTPFIAEQVLLLIAEKNPISVRQVYDILGYQNKQDRHAVSNAIWRMKKKGIIVIDDGIIDYKGSLPAKKKIDSIWDAMRNNPAVTVMELTCLSLATKKHVQNTISILKKKGLVRCVGKAYVNGQRGLRATSLYTLTTKERCRPL